MRNLQIGIIGSCSDLAYSQAAAAAAAQLGIVLARAGVTLVFGAEKDINSLPTIAARAAATAGGQTLGITYEKGLAVYDAEAATVLVASGLSRGGGRETTLMLSCNAAIALSGGSGTLNEMCIAYQANIPVICLTGFGGWSDKLAGTYLDDRRRYKFIAEATPEKAARRACQEARKYNSVKSDTI